MARGTLHRTSGDIKDFPWAVSITNETVNKTANTSTFTVTATVKSITTATAWTGVSPDPTLQIYFHNNVNNTNTLVASASYDTMGAGETKTLTGTVTAVHSNDGGGSGYAYAVWTKNASTRFVPESSQLTGELRSYTVIHRAISVAWNKSSVTVTADNSNEAVRYSFDREGSYYYKAVVTLNGKSRTDSLPTGYTYMTVTNNQLLTWLNNKTTATMKVTLYTYLDSGKTNLIGTSTASVNITVSTTNIHPTVTINSVTAVSNPYGSNAIAGYSKLKIVATVTGSSGSTTTTTVSCDSADFSSSSTTNTGQLTWTSQVVSERAANYTATVTVTARDARGGSQTKTATIAVKGYTAPWNRVTACYRTTSATSTNRDDAGGYVYVTWTSGVASIGGTNTKTDTATVGSTSITNGGHVALSVNSTATVTVKTTDKIKSVTSTAFISTGVIPLDLTQSSSGAQVGAAIGMPATLNQFDVGIKSVFHRGVYVDDVSIYNGNIDINRPTYGNPKITFRTATTSGIEAKIEQNHTDGSLLFDCPSIESRGNIFIQNDAAEISMFKSGEGAPITTNTLKMTAVNTDRDFDNNPRIEFSHAINALGGVFVNGHRCLFDYDIGKDGHGISVRWTGSKLEFYVDGTKVKEV